MWEHSHGQRPHFHTAAHPPTYHSFQLTQKLTPSKEKLKTMQVFPHTLQLLLIFCGTGFEVLTVTRIFQCGLDQDTIQVGKWSCMFWWNNLGLTSQVVRILREQVCPDKKLWYLPAELHSPIIRNTTILNLNILCIVSLHCLLQTNRTHVHYYTKLYLIILHYTFV